MSSALENEFTDILSKEIQREIDEGIMSNILVNQGWIPVRFYFKDGDQAVDINIWLLNHCGNKWRRLGSDYLFEDSVHAEWFILRWL